MNKTMKRLLSFAVTVLILLSLRTDAYALQEVDYDWTYDAEVNAVEDTDFDWEPDFVYGSMEIHYDIWYGRYSSAGRNCFTVSNVYDGYAELTAPLPEMMIYTPWIVVHFNNSNGGFNEISVFSYAYDKDGNEISNHKWDDYVISAEDWVASQPVVSGLENEAVSISTIVTIKSEYGEEFVLSIGMGPAYGQAKTDDSEDKKASDSSSSGSEESTNPFSDIPIVSDKKCGCDCNDNDEYWNSSYSDGYSDLTEEEATKLAIIIGLLTAGTAAGAATIGGKTPTPPNDEPPTYTLKDPMTGAETLYNFDPATGEWVSDDGFSVLDPDKVAEWQNQRAADRAWQDNVNKTFTTKADEAEYLKQKREAEEALKREEYVEKLALKYDMYGATAGEVYDKLLKNQEKAKEDLQHYTDRAAQWDTAVTIAEGVQTAADLGVEFVAAGMDATGIPGSAVYKKIYYGTRNLASNMTDAVVNKKNPWTAFGKACCETLVDCAQTDVAKKGYKLKLAANMTGDGFKAALDALDKGTDVGTAVLSGFFSGGLKTGMDWGMNKFVTGTNASTAKSVFSGQSPAKSKVVSVYANELLKANGIINGLKKATDDGQITTRTAMAAIEMVRNNASLKGKMIKQISSDAQAVVGKILDKTAEAASGRSGD